nr:uncharacterized protein LOC109421769 [Aedes albopictus]
METLCTPGKYIWGGNAGSHGIKFETDLAYALFVCGSLRQIPFRLATEMKEAGKWEDVVLFRDDLKEAWLFQAKHSDRIGDGIRFEDLFPNNCDVKKELALHMYLQAMMQCRLKKEFRAFRIKFFLFTNKSLSVRAKLEQLLNIESRTVDELMRWNNGGVCHQGFGPKDTRVETLVDAMNFELVAVRDGIVDLLENGKVSNILVKYKTPLKSVLRLSGGRLQFKEEFTTSLDHSTHRWLFEELQKHFIWNKDDEIKSTTGKPLTNKISPPIKALFEGNSRDKCFPILAKEQDVRDFFASFILCLRQPDPKQVVNDAINSWMRRWIPPNDLRRFSEAQKTLPRIKFYETFKSWHELVEKEKDFVSFHVEGRKCVEAIVTELRQHMSVRSNSLERCYVPRFIQEVDKRQDCAVSDAVFIANIGERKRTVLIGEPGMGKTTWMEQVAFELQKNTDMEVFLIYLNKLDGRTKATNKHRFEVFGSELSEMNLNALETSLNSGTKRTILLLDGYDELSESCQSAIIKILRESMSYDNLCLIVSGRKHKQDHLEVLLRTTAICLVPFKYEEQIHFLKMFWGVAIDNYQKQLKFRSFATNLIEKLHTNIKAEYFCFTGLPLMIRMLAEIYAQDFERSLNSFQEDLEQKLLSSRKLNLLDLFEQFTCMSLNMQMKKILNQDAYSTLQTNVDRRFKINIEQFDLEHQLAAIKQLAINELQHCVKNQNYSQTTLEYIKRIQDGEEKSLLITASTDNRIEFIHRSYAEYFAAKYLYRNVSECESVLLKVLQRHKVVQIFFFMMIEENFEASPQQVKILENICKQDSDVAFLACSGDHVKIVKKLLENRSAKSMRKRLKGTLLHAAANAGSFNVVSLLFEKYHFSRPRAKNKVRRFFQDLYLSFLQTNVDINGQDGDGCTPLFLATRNGHLEIVNLLLYHSANVDIPNYDKINPLHIAYRCGHLELVHILIGLSKNLNSTDDRAKTLLHWAAASGDLETARMLLNRSVNIDVQDAVRWTPLHYAVDTGGYEMVELLISHGPEINTPDESGRTPLHWVALNGRVEIGKLLLDHKANLDPQDNDRCTPLHLSFTYRNLDMLNLLISRSANINISNNNGQNLLHLACKKGDLLIFKILLKHSASVNIADRHGWTPLHFATSNDYVQIVKLLIEHSANVNVPTKSGQTALHMAARNGYLEIVKVLLAHSAVHCHDNKLQTPLRLANRNGHLEIVKTLIAERPVNVNETYEDGCTALHYAIEGERMELVELLLLNGARVNIEDRNGVTPIDLAISKENEVLWDLLLENKNNYKEP